MYFTSINLFSYLSVVPVDWKSTTFSKNAKPSERRGKNKQTNRKTLNYEVVLDTLIVRYIYLLSMT